MLPSKSMLNGDQSIGSELYCWYINESINCAQIECFSFFLKVKEIGDYFKQHLLQSRHRGAFELAYTGFVKLTEILNR